MNDYYKNMRTKIRPYLHQSSDYMVTIVATGIHAVLLFVYGIFVKHYVEPVEYGFYSTANIVLTYLNYMQLGVLNSYNRDFPNAIGEGNQNRVKKLKDVTVTYIIVVYLAVGIIISAGAIICASFNGIKIEVAYGIVLMCIVALISNVVSVFTVEYKSYGKFRYAAIITIVSTFVQVIIGGAFVYHIGYYGIYVALILFNFSSLILLTKRFKEVSFSFDTSYIFQQVKTGFPLLVNSLIWTLIMTSDQFIILAFRDSEYLGLYSVAQTVFSVMVLIPQTVSQVMYIKLSGLYGQTNDKKLLLSATLKASKILMIVSCSILALTYTVIPEFVGFFMPLYKDGIGSARILCIGVAIYGSTMALGNLFSILKENRRLLRSSIILCIANIVLSCGCVLLFGFKLEYVALGSALSYVIYGFTLMKNTHSIFNNSIIGSVKAIFLPIIFTSGIVIAVNSLIDGIFIRVLIMLLLLSMGTMLYMFYRKRKGTHDIDSR